MRAWITTVILISLFLLGGCGPKSGENQAGGKINIVTTIGMITDVAGNIGGDNTNVVGLMGPGVDPHLYKASAGDVRRMESADIIFYNGLHLEGAMAELFDKMKTRVTTVAVSSGIPEDSLISPPEFEGLHDPHIWFDVELWIYAARRIEKTLIEYDSAHADSYRRNAAAYIRRLDSLNRHVTDLAGTVPEDKRVLVTAHDAFNYFGRAYGFEVRGIQGISTATEAGTADIQKLAEFIVRKRIPAVFVESSVPRRTVEALQAAVKSRGHEVSIGGELYSDALGSPDTPSGTYIGMVRHNIETIVSALKEN